MKRTASTSASPATSGRIIRFGEAGYRQCGVTVMDTTDPDISFDDNGTSSWVTDTFERIKATWDPQGNEALFSAAVDRIKSSCSGKAYDCVIGLSGGLDSSYLAYCAWKAGLRALAVHTDTGWNSEIAVDNIERVVNKCEFELHTNVVDWPEMADVQRAFLRAGVPNQDIPQDHAIFAALYKFAATNGIKYVLSGQNYATESVLPRAWVYNNRDAFHVRSIHRRFGDLRLRRFPLMGSITFSALYKGVLRMQVVRLLDLVRYVREDAIGTLSRELGWRDYGGKHFESRWTRFYQGFWLPNKFGFDKRRAHLSSLILSGQISRPAALAALNNRIYEDGSLQEDRRFVANKLAISESELERLFTSANHNHSDYPNAAWLSKLVQRSRRISNRGA